VRSTAAVPVEIVRCSFKSGDPPNHIEGPRRADVVVKVAHPSAGSRLKRFSAGRQGIDGGALVLSGSPVTRYQRILGTRPHRTLTQRTRGLALAALAL
jgi:hypothetical protein